MFRTFRKLSTNKNTVIIGDTFIKNIQYPTCISCKYFLEQPHSQTPAQSVAHLSKCKKFGYMDVITGNIVYETVAKSRINDTMCKMEGVYHTNK